MKNIKYQHSWESDTRLSDILDKLNDAGRTSISDTLATAPVTESSSDKNFSPDHLHLALQRGRWMIEIRRQRTEQFAGNLFADPSWDIMLGLFVCRLETRLANIADACLSGTVPPTTNIRHLALLIDNGIVVRRMTNVDHDIWIFDLSDEAFDKMKEIILQKIIE